MPELKTLNTHITILMPRFGEVTGTATHECELEASDGLWRWRTLDRPGARPLVLQFASTFPRGWEVQRATAWELPRWSEPFVERLRAAESVEQVRAVLGAGGAAETQLYEVNEQPDQEEDPAQAPTWIPCERYNIPDALLAFAQAYAARRASAHRVALDVTMLEWRHAASSRGHYEHHGVPVVGWHAMRVAGSARFGGEEAQLVAELTVIDGQELTEVIDDLHVGLWIVPRKGEAAGAQVVLEQRPPFGLLGPSSARNNAQRR